MPSSTDLWTDLLSCLDLDEAPGPVYRGANQRLGYHRLFGGQLLAQFVRAACLACPGKTVKSLHTLFPRAGSDAEPVRYEVALHHEGSTFASLTVTARQEAGVIATASVSMHSAEDGRDVQSTPPVPSLPGPEHLVKYDLLPWENRTTVDLDDRAAAPPEFELWMRVPETAPELAPAVAAYATDLTLIGTAVLAVDGLSQLDAHKVFTSAVTSHTLWFHRPFTTGDWLLLRQHAPLLAHGRSFGRGDLLTGDGALVASYAQESLVRFPAG
ncbi:acyl-CoA thioesterase [Actinocorallia longicatena]|uniref:Acyl-CoA thioesterase II n=1 Tax=Actinocorallia longicatena TaxID=111803 RepID=A0ABP6Q5R2_9ACTN